MSHDLEMRNKQKLGHPIGCKWYDFIILILPSTSDGLVLFIDWYYPDSDKIFVQDNALCQKRLSG